MPFAPVESIVETSIRRSGYGTGMLARISAFASVKTPRFAPIASANVASAVSVKPGFLRSVREAWRRSLAISRSMLSLYYDAGWPALLQ